MLALLLPQALGLTIPMALLLGILIGFGRLSADREFVALQACGISIFRVLRPVAGLAVACVCGDRLRDDRGPPERQSSLPRNRVQCHRLAGRERCQAASLLRGLSEPRPVRPGHASRAAGWRDVFVADSTRPDETSVYLAEGGRMIVDREQQVVELLLETGTRHTTFLKEPEKYEGSSFDRLVLRMDADLVLPRARTLLKGDNEMTIAELRAEIARAHRRGRPIRPAVYDSAEVRDSRGLPGSGVDRSGAWSDEPQGRQARRVRSWLRRDLDLLLPALDLARTRRRRHDSADVCAMDRQRRARRRLASALVMWRAGAADQQFRITLPTLGRRASADGSVEAARPRRDRITPWSSDFPA